jgi:tRNA pseudouridine38-40 synthase
MAPARRRGSDAGRVAAAGQPELADRGRRHLTAVIEYDGTDYHGFQAQRNARTVQPALQEALARVTQQHVDIRYAGRTDAGVHAVGQVVDFRTNWSRSLAELHRAWNALLPLDIAVRSVEPAPPGFHPRYSASSRVYRYSIWNHPIRSPLHERCFYHVVQRLDASGMAAAARTLSGEHDFRSFGAPMRAGGSTVRRVQRVDVWRDGDELFIEIEANAFLRHMVRRIVAGLVDVGHGRLAVAELSDALAAADPGRLQGLAPASGLCLMRVNY